MADIESATASAAVPEVPTVPEMNPSRLLSAEEETVASETSASDDFDNLKIQLLVVEAENEGLIVENEDLKEQNERLRDEDQLWQRMWKEKCLDSKEEKEKLTAGFNLERTVLIGDNNQLLEEWSTCVEVLDATNDDLISQVASLTQSNVRISADKAALERAFCEIQREHNRCMNREDFDILVSAEPDRLRRQCVSLLGAAPRCTEHSQPRLQGNEADSETYDASPRNTPAPYTERVLEFYRSANMAANLHINDLETEIKAKDEMIEQFEKQDELLKVQREQFAAEHERLVVERQRFEAAYDQLAEHHEQLVVQHEQLEEQNAVRVRQLGEQNEQTEVRYRELLLAYHRATCQGVRVVGMACEKCCENFRPSNNDVVFQNFR